MSKTRKPIAFDPNDPAVQVDAGFAAAQETVIREKPKTPRKSGIQAKEKAKPSTDNTISQISMMADDADDTRQLPATLETKRRRGVRWGTLLLSALGALVSFAAGLAITDLVESLFARADWLGWTALGLAAIAGIAFLMICMREIAALMRLRKISQLHDASARATRDKDIGEAKIVVATLKTIYAGRSDCSWGLARLNEAEEQVFDADDLLKVAERDLMKNLDVRAAQEIARAVRRVSVVTAVSPAALLDMGFVLVANISMLRKLAALYGGRPGAIGLFRLSRLVIAHLTVTGGIAIGDGLLQQVFGHGVAAKLSARLGEGVLNGLFTARIGLAALAVCRPLPFQTLAPPTIKELMSEVALPTK